MGRTEGDLPGFGELFSCRLPSTGPIAICLAAPPSPAPKLWFLSCEPRRLSPGESVGDEVMSRALGRWLGVSAPLSGSQWGEEAQGESRRMGFAGWTGLREERVLEALPWTAGVVAWPGMGPEISEGQA